MQLRSITEIMLKSPFLCVNRSPIHYSFRAGAKAIWYGVDIALSIALDKMQNKNDEKLTWKFE